jgi:tRNA G18 (ribose-2'-O)-methylase SpoU
MHRKLTHDEISKNRINAHEIHSKMRNPIYVLADNIRSLYNVGSLFRSADGALVKKLYLTGYTPHPPRKEIEKTALGATLTVPWEYFRDPLDAIAELHDQKVSVCVVEHTNRSIPYYQIQPSEFPICLVVGNEITGVSKEIIEAADMAIEIPMFGTKQSLNVSVAFGIVLYEAVKILQTGTMK